MNEQDISNAVRAVLEQMNETSPHHAAEHVCKCKKHRMTLNLANALIERVKAYAKEMGVNVVIAVSDKAGRPVAVQCMDDAYIASFDIALNKAYTACALRMSTLSLKPMAQPGGQLYGIQHTNGGKIVVFGGGVPLMKSGRLIGGLGVSGGTEAQDSALAEYGASILEEEISCRLTKRN